MIKYSHGTWGLVMLLRISGSVFPKALIWSCPAAIASAMLMWFKIKSGYHDDTGGSIGMLSVASFVSILGFLVVFRSNQAWARFWEGADLLQQARGQWINAVSSLFAFCSRKEEHAEKVSKLQAHVIRLMSLLYSESIARLCDDMVLERLELSGLDAVALAELDEEENYESKVELLTHWIQRLVIDGISDGIVTAAPPIVSRVFNELSNGMVKVQAAQKIKEIQFPFHYAQMLGVMLIVYTMGVPAMCAYMMTTYYGAAGSTFLNVFVLWCVNYLSVEIEQPFGGRPNDLPLHDEMKKMNDGLRALASRVAKKPAVYSGTARLSMVATEVLVAKEGASTIQVTKVPSLSRSMTMPTLSTAWPALKSPKLSKESGQTDSTTNSGPDEVEVESSPTHKEQLRQGSGGGGVRQVSKSHAQAAARARLETTPQSPAQSPESHLTTQSLSPPGSPMQRFQSPTGSEKDGIGMSRADSKASSRAGSKPRQPRDQRTIPVAFSPPAVPTPRLPTTQSGMSPQTTSPRPPDLQGLPRPQVQDPHYIHVDTRVLEAARKADMMRSNSSTGIRTPAPPRRQ